MKKFIILGRPDMLSRTRKRFKNLLKDNNLKPEECVYFDDQEKNIEEAKKLGIKSFLFKGVGSLTKILKTIK